MAKSLSDYEREWQGNAEADALWVILTDSRYYGRKWDADEFFATGEEEADRIFRFMELEGLRMPSGTFLDFGCGVGRLSRALEKRFSHGFGVDISPKMIELARTFVPQVDFMVNQTDSLEAFKDCSVDFVYSHIVLQHIPNQYQRHYIDEFLRVLRPGGLAVFQLPIEIIRPREIGPSLVSRLKQVVKQRFPFLITTKRLFVPPKQFHYEFRYEMHPLPHSEVLRICAERHVVIEAAPATNSCEPDHNGRIEFYDRNTHRRRLDECGLPNRYLSCMYFVRRPALHMTSQHA